MFAGFSVVYLLSRLTGSQFSLMNIFKCRAFYEYQHRVVFFYMAFICFISPFTTINKPMFHFSSYSCCTVFVDAGLKIWQEPFLLSCSFQYCSVILYKWCFLGTFLTFFLKLKAFSKTFLCLALATVPAGKLIIPRFGCWLYSEVQKSITQR